MAFLHCFHTKIEVPTSELPNYNTNNYNLASYYFNRFIGNYPNSSKLEEATYLVAHSHYLASPYRGTDVGMLGGEVVVDGKVGSDCACHMKGGIIKIKGGAGPFLGYHMIKGTIYVEKDCKSRAGASMTGGKIIVNGVLEEVMPTFTVDDVKKKAKVDDNEKVTGPFYVFVGDLAEHGKGKLFVSKAANPRLADIYDKYLE